MCVCHLIIKDYLLTYLHTRFQFDRPFFRSYFRLGQLIHISKLLATVTAVILQTRCPSCHPKTASKNHWGWECSWLGATCCHHPAVLLRAGCPSCHPTNSVKGTEGIWGHSGQAENNVSKDKFSRDEPIKHSINYSGRNGPLYRLLMTMLLHFYPLSANSKWYAIPDLLCPGIVRPSKCSKQSTYGCSC